MLKKIHNLLTGETRYGVFLKEEFSKSYYALTDKRNTELLVIPFKYEHLYLIRFANYIGEPFPSSYGINRACKA